MISIALRILAVVAIYVAVSSTSHFIVFPVPSPPDADRPGHGTQVRLPGGSTFVYIKSASETDGAFFEASWVGEPGASIPTHTHPSQEVSFKIQEGEFRVELANEVRVLGPGEAVSIPAGVPHKWGNASPELTRGIFRIEPAGMADFVFVQLHRAFGGDASPVETAVQTFILIGTHGKHTAFPIRALCFLVSPTARIFGYRSYYEPLGEGV